MENSKPGKLSLEDLEYHAKEKFPAEFSALAATKGPKFLLHDSFANKDVIQERLCVGWFQGKRTVFVYAYMFKDARSVVLCRGGTTPDFRNQTLSAPFWYEPFSYLHRCNAPADSQMERLRVLIRYYFLQRKLIPHVEFSPEDLARFESACKCIAKKKFLSPANLAPRRLVRMPKLDGGTGGTGSKAAVATKTSTTIFIDDDLTPTDTSASKEPSATLKRPKSTLENTTLDEKSAEERRTAHMNMNKDRLEKQYQAKKTPGEPKALTDENAALRQNLEAIKEAMAKANSETQATLRSKQSELDAVIQRANTAETTLKHRLADKDRLQSHLDHTDTHAKSLECQLEEEKKQRIKAEKMLKVFQNNHEKIMHKAGELYDYLEETLETNFKMTNSSKRHQETILKALRDEFGELKRGE